MRTFLATRRARVIACDTRPPVLAQIANTYGVATSTDWRESLDVRTITGAVIATSAPLHVAIARQLLAGGRHVLIEKPLALELAGTDALVVDRDCSGKFAALTYVLHFVPALQAARAFLSGGTFGSIRHVAAISGEHFPSSRPAYGEIHYRDHAQGGGAIQDALTHLANAVEWIVGPATRVFCDAAHQVLEGVSVEDTVTVRARHGDVLASYSLNQFQAPSETCFDFHAETGSVRVESHAQRWGIGFSPRTTARKACV